MYNNCMQSILKRIVIALMLIYCVFFNLLIILQFELFGSLIIDYTSFRLIILAFDFFYILTIFNKEIHLDILGKTVILLLIAVFCSFCIGTFVIENLSESLGVIIRQVFFIFIIWTLTLDGKKINIGTILKLLTAYSVINGVMCILQYINQSVLLGDYYIDGESIYKSVFYFGSFQRSCGFFTSGLDVGILLCFGLMNLLVSLRRCKRIRTKLLWLLLVGILIFSIYTTRTRNVYLLCAILLFFIVVGYIPKIGKSTVYRVSIVFSIIITILFVWIISVYLGDDDNVNSINSTVSLNIRMQSWIEWLNDFADKNIIVWLFGDCTSQSRDVVVDNIYLEYLGSFGLIGLLLFIVFICRIISKLIYNLNSNRVAIAFACSSFSFGILNLPATFYMIYLPYLISTMGDYQQKESLKNSEKLNDKMLFANNIPIEV